MQMYAATNRGITITTAGGTLHGRAQRACSLHFCEALGLQRPVSRPLWGSQEVFGLSLCGA